MFNREGMKMVKENQQNAAQPEKLLRLPAVVALVGLQKSSIYDAIKRGDFPSPVKLSRRAVCWPASAIDAWIAQRIKASAES
jgi:prophage regulatory protein